MAERATAYLHFRATDVQKAEIVKRAKAEGKTLSAYLLDRALGDGGAEQKPAPGEVAPSEGPDVHDVSPIAEQPESREEYITRRRRILYGQGLTTRQAMTQAEREARERYN